MKHILIENLEAWQSHKDAIDEKMENMDYRVGKQTNKHLKCPACKKGYLKFEDSGESIRYVILKYECKLCGADFKVIKKFSGKIK